MLEKTERQRTLFTWTGAFAFMTAIATEQLLGVFSLFFVFFGFELEPPFTVLQ